MSRPLVFAAVWFAFLGLPHSACAADAALDKPLLGEWGFDLAGADLNISPGKDFFRYANGTWLDKTEIPPDKPIYSLRVAMTDLTEQRLHEIMEQESASPSAQASALEQIGRAHV